VGSRKENSINGNQKQERAEEENMNKFQLQEKTPYVEDILGRILERLGRLEEAKEREWMERANRS